MNVLDPTINTPFIFDGVWRKNLSEVELSTRSIDAMFKSNPSILMNNIDRSNKLINDYISSVHISQYTEMKFKEIWTNLIAYFYRLGYTHHEDGTPITEENIHDNGQFTFINSNGEKAFVDISFSGKATTKMMSKIEGFNHRFLIMEGSSATKDENMTILSPLILSISPSQHILSPPVKRVTDIEITTHAKTYPTIDASDPLMREMGFVKGDVIEVDDFSRHYRTLI